MSEIRTNLLKSERGDASPSAPFGLRVSGVSTTTTLNVTGNATISGNLGVAGTITYEDVARVDATGISTFREGFKLGPLAGIALTAYKDGSIRSTGIITAANFYGDGSNLTGISAGTSLSGSTNNTVCTVTGANAIQGESSLTFDGTTLMNAGGTITAERGAIPSIEAKNSTDTSYARFYCSQTSGSGGYAAFQKLGTNSSAIGGANATQIWCTGDAPLVIGVNNGERLRIGSTGNLALGTTNTDGGSGHTNIFLGGMGNIYAETTASNSASLSTSNNAYIPSSGGWKYRTGGRASNIYHYDGGIGFRYAASGSAGGAITWSEAYKIRNDGSVFFKIPNTNYDTTAGIILSNYTDGSRNVTPGTLICSTTDIPFIANLSDSNDGIVAVWRKGGSSKGNVQISGNSTAYNTSSDYRLKENNVSISDGITRLKLLKPYRFNWKSDPDMTIDGFFAHEVTPAVPEAVTGEKDSAPGDCGMGYQSMDHSKLVPLLTAALQEAVTKIETLEADVGNLKSEVAALKSS